MASTGETAPGDVVVDPVESLGLRALSEPVRASPGAVRAPLLVAPSGAAQLASTSAATQALATAAARAATARTPVHG
ncbi:MAG: hypothetical protein JNK53_02700 [Phycisphaerae bacterium]|nr:hypothetical protein [Phycisphaerae bacterium]